MKQDYRGLVAFLAVVAAVAATVGYQTGYQLAQPGPPSVVIIYQPHP